MERHLGGKTKQKINKKEDIGKCFIFSFQNMAHFICTTTLGQCWQNWGNMAQMLCVHNAFLWLSVPRMKLPLVKCGTRSSLPSLERVAPLSASIKTKPLPPSEKPRRLHSGWSAGRPSYKIERDFQRPTVTDCAPMPRILQLFQWPLTSTRLARHLTSDFLSNV